MVYKPDDDGTESDLLLQQLVPKSYLVLQKAIKEKVNELRANSKHPIQKKDEFLYDHTCTCTYPSIFIFSQQQFLFKTDGG